MKNIHMVMSALAGFLYDDDGMRIKFKARVGTVHSCNPSQHNVLRYDQVERQRKNIRRARRKSFKGYKRAKT